MLVRVLLTIMLLLNFSIVQAASLGLADKANTLAVKDKASFKGIALSEVAQFLSSQTGLNIVCVPETSGEKIDLEIMANEKLSQIFEEVSQKYNIGPMFQDKKKAILFVKGQSYSRRGQPAAVLDFVGKVEFNAGKKTTAASNVTYAYATFDPSMLKGSVDTEEYKAEQENRFHDAVTSPLSTFSIDVDTASYSNVRRFINSGRLPASGAVRTEEMINYFTYDYPEPADGQPFSVTTEAALCPWNPKHSLVMIGLKGKNMNVAELPPTNLVFLIDVSGSMGETNKLPLVKTTAKMLINQLRPQDSVSIVTYASSTKVVLDSASGNEKNKILQVVDSLEAGGSTDGAAVSNWLMSWPKRILRKRVITVFF